MLPGRHGRRTGEPHQDHGGNEHRRAASPPGRPAHHADRRQGHRRPRGHRRDHLGREVRDAYSRQEPLGAAPARPRHADGHPRDLLQARQGPFGMVLCAGPTGSGKTTTLYATLDGGRRPDEERDDDRGPGRVRLPVHQPDPDERAGRPDVRHRAQVDPAPGPRRDPRRGDPRCRDGPHRRAVRADRPLGALVAARHRLRVGPAPLPRHGHRVVPHRLIGARHRRPAARATDLPVVQDRATRRRRRR